MKKLFTLIAAAFVAVGMNAQTIVFDAYADKTAEGAADDLVIEVDGFKAELDGGNKAKIAAKSLTFVEEGATTAENKEQFSYQYNPGGGITKTSGERSLKLTVPAAGTLYVYPRSGNNTATDRTVTITQNGTAIVDAKVVSDANFTTVINEATYYYSIKAEVAKGEIFITTNNAINFSGFKFVAAEGDEPGDEPGEEPTTQEGTYDFETAAKALENSNENFPTYDGVRIFNVQNPSWINIEKMTLTQLETNGRFAAEARTSNGFNLRKAGGDWNGLNSGYAAVRYFSILDLKAGDKVTITYNQGALENYTRDGSATITGLADAAAIVSGTEYTIAANGRFDMKTGTEKVNIQKIVIGSTTGIQNVAAATKAQDGKMYNLAGQEVGKGFKGIAIMNGRKVIIK